MRKRIAVVLNLLVLASWVAVAQSRGAPLMFEPNLGQANTAAAFVAHTPHGAAQFDPSGVTLRRGVDTIRIAFRNANPATRLSGLGPTGGRANYFIGPKANWIGGIPLYRGVRYAEVYPGIDVDFHSPGSSPGESSGAEHGGDLEYDFLLAPGAKVSAIRLAFSGIQTTYLDRGDLVLKTSQGEFRHRHPRLYREKNGKRLEIGGGYVLRGRNEVGFEVAPGWADSPLVIDPVVTYSTFMGGGGNTMAWAVAVDSAGCIYLAGETLPVNFGATFQVSDSTSSTDAFLVKMNSAGTAMVYAAYFGGTGRSSARGVAVDSGGNAYITGFAYSTDFPTTAGAYRSSTLGMADVFAMKLNPTGSALVYSALFGGAGNDLATGIAIDSSGNAYISGSTASLAFPITNAFQSSYGGGVQDAFVTKINSTGSTLLYSTFLGGTGNDVANGIAVDSSGSAYVAGYTDSLNFPTASALYGAPAGQGDAFVAKLTPSGTGLVFATYLGGSQVDVADAIAIDSVDNVFVTGTTLSTNFPVTAGAFQAANAGSYDAFVTELNSEGRALVYSTYLGGEGSDQANAIAVLGDVAYVAGFTYSHYYPVQDAVQSALGGAQDAFVTAIASGGNSLVWSTYCGGLEDDQANGIAVDSSASAYIAGWTLSSNFPVTGGAFQTAYAVESGFLVKLSTSTTTATTPLQFVPVAPCRIIDTRSADGPLGGPSIPAHGTRSIPVPSSSCGIPSNAAAYSLNVTVVPPLDGVLGYLTVWPTGQPQPNVSTLNSLDGEILANAAIVPAGTGGSIDAFATDDTDLVIDINGYFVPHTTGSLQFYPLTPCRILDTRNTPNGTFAGPSLAADTARSFPIQSSGCNVPASAEAYAFNVTVVPPLDGVLGYLTVWPTGESQPFVSTLNSLEGNILANAAIVPAGSGGAVSFFATNTTDLVVDINGYFAAPAAGGLNFYTVPPCRIVDTRGATGTFGGPIMGASTTRTFPLSQGPCGISDSAAAYSLNMTVVPPASLGFLTIWPAGDPLPQASTLNALEGQIVANAALVPAGTGGGIDVFVTNATHVIIDTNGYFQ
jgi:hypothetical protein